MKKLLFIFISVLPVFACKADIIVVDANGTGDYPTIQAAINAANDFDVVELQPGTYTGDGNRDIDYLGKPITVRSINPNDPNIVAATVIDCNGMETELHRGFRFDSNEDGNSILMGLTIANGYGPEEQVLGLPSLLSVGGAIFCKASSPYIFNCVIKNNEAFYGGGMFNHENSKPKIVNCTFLNNRVPSNSRGGAMVNDKSNPTLVQCSFIGNHGGGAGGAIQNFDSKPNFINCTFTANRAPLVFLSAGGGGAICNNGGSPILSNCIFAGNYAYWGGAISNEGSTPKITNSTFHGNSWCAICNWWDASNPILKNCILWDNGSEILNKLGGSIDISYSDVNNGWPGLGNIDVDPCFVEPGYWDPNSTPADANDDFWVDGDYHLRSQGWRWDTQRQVWTWDDVTSRCIDAGNPGSPLADERLSVPPDPDNIWGENLRINMGAYGGTAEASMPPYNWALLADLTNDGIVDFIDFAYQAEDWLKTCNEQPGDLDRSGYVDSTDVGLLTNDWLKETIWQ